MWAQQQNITFMIGTGRTITFGPLIDDVTGLYVDLTSAHAKWRMAKKPTSIGTDIMIRKTDTDGIAFSSEALYGDVRWFVNVMLVPADTISLAPSLPPVQYYHELTITDGSGNVSVLATGLFELVPSINARP